MKVLSCTRLRFLSYRMMSSKTRIAVCQMCSKEDKQENIQQAKSLIEKAVQDGAKMCFLPEGFDSICSNKRSAVESGEPLSGPTITTYRDIAKDNDMWLSLGGFKHKESSSASRIRNTHVLINNLGEVVSTYSKIHLYDVDIPGKVTISESSFAEPGEIITKPVTTPIGNLALGICYDMRFADMSAIQRRYGADVLTFPSAFMVPTGQAHWHVLLRNRAIETQCYVIAAAQVNKHNEKRSSYGHSLVVDPWGKIQCEIDDEIGVECVDIDLNEVRNRRIGMPIESHQRTDIYAEGYFNSDERFDSIDSEPGYNFSHIKISSGFVFYKSRLSYAFVNKKPVLPGHMLIAPLRIVSRFNQLTAEEINDLWNTAKLVSKALEKAFPCPSLTFTIQDGAEAGQSIPHVHIHVLPRRKGDFKNNDDVYDKLESHDKDKSGQLLPSTSSLWRSEDVMFHEACMMRDMMKTVL